MPVPTLSWPDTVSAVEEAYGNWDAANVDEAKKTPAVLRDEEVAEVEVPKVVNAVNGYAEPPHDWVDTTPEESVVRQLPAPLPKPETTKLVVEAAVAVTMVVEA